MPQRIPRLARIAHCAAVATLLAFAGSAATAQDSDDLSRFSYEGTLGQARIGLTLIVQARNSISGGHYFYAKYLTDIPLTGKMGPGSVTLHGADGGSFDLRFKGNGSEGGQPMDFRNTVGLDGTWSKDGKSLQVTLGMRDSAAAGGRWYQYATDESDAAFEARAQGFYKAVMAGDRAGAAKYVAFPLRVNGTGKSRYLRSPAELRAQWESVFTPGFIAGLRNYAPHDMSVVKGQAMLGPGSVFFSDRGATTLNVF
jgi:hypothetical protein